MKKERKNGLIIAFLSWAFVSIAVFVTFPDAVNTLGFYAGALFNGEMWRLLSFPLVHSSTLHLIENLVGLFILLLIALEVNMNVKEYALVFLLSTFVVGISGAFLFPETIIVGSSLGVFALFGAILTLRIEKIYPKWLLLGGFTLLVVANLVFKYLFGGNVLQEAFHATAFFVGPLILFARDKLYEK